MPYEGEKNLIAIVRRGLGSLVSSVFSNNAEFTRNVALGIGDTHGRVLVVDSSVDKHQTGYGNVMPDCLHGGPGRAGGGEELGGLRALLLYHRRFVVQAASSRLSELTDLSAKHSISGPRHTVHSKRKLGVCSVRLPCVSAVSMPLLHSHREDLRQLNGEL